MQVKGYCHSKMKQKIYSTSKTKLIPVASEHAVRTYEVKWSVSYMAQFNLNIIFNITTFTQPLQTVLSMFTAWAYCYIMTYELKKHPTYKSLCGKRLVLTFRRKINCGQKLRSVFASVAPWRTFNINESFHSTKG